jgi:hypothetical protein
VLQHFNRRLISTAPLVIKPLMPMPLLSADPPLPSSYLSD